MRYIDTASRRGEETLAAWFQAVLTDDVTELRWQSGFFFAEGAGLLIPTLERLKRAEGIVRGVIGADARSTLRDDVAWLVGAIGIPRKGAALGAVSFARGLFHPKTYHVVRRDGSEVAYVGSANLTAPAVSGRNVEAGLVLDTRSGDSRDVLRAIADGVDWWFEETRDGFNPISALATVQQLTDDGILVEALPPRLEVPIEAGDADGADEQVRVRRPGLHDLVELPRVRPRVATSPREGARSGAATVPRPVGLAVPRRGFPDYFLFDPVATQPTSGASGLSGALLPGGAVGLIVQLNKDSARHFERRNGTANMSLPIASLASLRFGIFAGKYERPRAEFDLHVRFLRSAAAPIVCEVLETSVMAYGYADGEPGHRDIRMVVPAGVRVLAERIQAAGHGLPAVNDLALLEWPAPGRPDFRLSYLEPGSAIAAEAAVIFQAAKSAREMVGGRACWLLAGLSPQWT
jgi:hypothetical protein